MISKDIKQGSSYNQIPVMKLSSSKRTILIASGIALVSMMLFSDLCCGTQWVLYYNRAIEGRAVDADTGKPIGDALVIGMWQLSSYLIEGFDGFAKITLEKTDAKGAFSKERLADGLAPL